MTVSRRTWSGHPGAGKAREASTRLRLEPLEQRDLPSFLPPVAHPLSGLTMDLAVADLNGDGNLDLIAPHAGVNGQGLGVGPISILNGNADGTFASPVNIDPAVNPTRVVAGDFNGDGKPDLAEWVDLPKRHEWDLRILLNLGKDQFKIAHQYVMPFYSHSMVVTDINGDGKQDLVMTPYTTAAEIITLLGNGDGSFKAPVTSPGGLNSIGMVLGDFNHDGNLDVATVQSNLFGKGKVEIQMGNGDGTFKAPTLSYGVGDDPSAIVVGDVNGDGIPDLVAVDGGGTPYNFPGGLSVLLGKGDGTFAPGVFYLDAGRILDQAAVGDINGDGKPDVVVSEDTGVGIFLNQGNGTFAAPTHIALGGGAIPMEVRVGDFNHDGLLDIAVNAGGGITTILQAPGAGAARQLLTAPGLTAEEPSAPPIPGSASRGDSGTTTSNALGVLDTRAGQADGISTHPSAHTGGQASMLRPLSAFDNDGTSLDEATARLDIVFSGLLSEGVS